MCVAALQFVVVVQFVARESAMWLFKSHGINFG
jgi:hypothetical protein